MVEKNTRSISCYRLTKIYEKRKKKALDSVTFSVPSKGIFVLIGRNGSGKTTLVRILATELEPTSGSAKINGINVVNDPIRLREKIAIVPQEARTVPWMTPMQIVTSYLLWRGFDHGEAKQRAKDTLAKLGLSEEADTLSRRLSGGIRRKVLVATVLASEAEIIFLDEPTTGLDPISRKEFWDFIKDVARDRFTFLTTHYLEEAEELASRIGILDRGKLIRIGTMNQLRQSMNYSYSMKIPLGPGLPVLKVKKGEVIAGRDFYRIFTVEDEAFRISKVLAKGGHKFAINPVSLDDIFFYTLSQKGGKPLENQRMAEEGRQFEAEEE